MRRSFRFRRSPRGIRGERSRDQGQRAKEQNPKGQGGDAFGPCPQTPHYQPPPTVRTNLHRQSVPTSTDSPYQPPPTVRTNLHRQSVPTSTDSPYQPPPTVRTNLHRQSVPTSTDSPY